ncbi:MAG TPA: AlkA N-terminal domain-containing protein [Polyangiaceae bacterium]
MNLDADACYRVLRARDRRFDGVFFVAVTTTGIYCRPICPARTPGRDRVRFFARAAECEREGFRACFRCRPEVAPGKGAAAVDAKSALVRAALSKIEDGCLNEQSLEDLAKSLDVSSRHLRRSIEAEVGVSPVLLAQTRRLALAKQLLHDTRLPMAEIAHASGFASVRRFNSLVRARFGRPPTALRKEHGTKSSDGTFALRLDYRPPFDWEHLLEFLGDRATTGIERVERGKYFRAVAIDGEVHTVAVENDEERSRIVAHVPAALAPKTMEISARLRHLFDLDARPSVIEEVLLHDPMLAPRVKKQRGTRVPGAFDPFEIALRTVLGQQVTVKGATTLASRLVKAFGTNVDPKSEIGWIFPAPERVASASIASIRALGMPESRAKTIQGVARAVADGVLDLSAGADPEHAARVMTSIHGVGNFTSHVVAMRALRWADAFPASDLGVRKALGSTSTKELERKSEAWRPWRAYAVIHLWRNHHGG